MENLKVKIKLLEDGKLPEYKRDGDVCLDCYAREDFKIIIDRFGTDWARVKG